VRLSCTQTESEKKLSDVMVDAINGNVSEDLVKELFTQNQTRHIIQSIGQFRSDLEKTCTYLLYSIT